MKTIRANRLNWDVQLESIEEKLMVVATCGIKIYIEWINRDHLCLEDVDHAEGCEHLTDKDVNALVIAINSELEKLAIKTGYTPSRDNYGYAGTMECAEDDEKVQDLLEMLF